MSKETKQRDYGWQMKSMEHHSEPDFSRFTVGEAPGCTIHPYVVCPSHNTSYTRELSTPGPGMGFGAWWVDALQLACSAQDLGPGVTTVHTYMHTPYVCSTYVRAGKCWPAQRTLLPDTSIWFPSYRVREKLCLIALHFLLFST